MLPSNSTTFPRHLPARHAPWLPPHVEEHIEQRKRRFEETLVYLNRPRFVLPEGARILPVVNIGEPA